MKGFYSRKLIFMRSGEGGEGGGGGESGVFSDSTYIGGIIHTKREPVRQE